ncbi:MULTISPECIES: carph-isopro domain-containing protein [unclassified Caballeronia]|uniref:carph-isopro domain-containing protein n=1 Tax=unclassified Caballeronia TaxID=2646786 RepID=UPI0028641D4C|nr:MULTISPECIES: YdaS family helix-turn-helix protein [unclassified Caballeronia]MDR5777278.1 YdaS family helix-turn-helix protein [Caballeronia sp. LZ002]MDR5852716.1 YdaS family helix-turn-helix protein [Caballeronia sp. LZ003]
MKPSALIDALGGTTAVARLLGITAPSVHAWRKGGIPDDKLIRLAPLAEKRGVCCRRDLRPVDWHLIWPELAEEQGAFVKVRFPYRRKKLSARDRLCPTRPRRSAAIRQEASGLPSLATSGPPFSQRHTRRNKNSRGV